MLLPIFTPPARGAFGSEFHTTLRVLNASDTHDIPIFGADQPDFGGTDHVTLLRPGAEAVLGRNAAPIAFPSVPIDPRFRTTLTDFPTSGNGAINVVITPPALTLSPVSYGPPIRAMLTITNNDTQQITTMTPQR